MTKFRWFILGMLIVAVGWAGIANAQVPQCTAALSDALGPNGGTFAVGDAIEFFGSVEVPPSGGGVPNCTLTNVQLWFFPPPDGEPDPCEVAESGTLILTIPVLEPGDIVTFDASTHPILTYITQPSDAGTFIEGNMAVTFFIEGIPDQQCDEKAAINFVQCPPPCIEVTKEVDCGISKVGDEVVYSICVENCGTYDLTGVVVSDPRLGGNLAGFPSVLAPGQRVCVDFPYTIQPGDEPGPVLNTAHARGTDACDGVTVVQDDSDVVTVQLIHPDFTVTKTCLTDPVEAGGNADFEIIVTNTGDVALNFTTDEAEIGPFSLDPGANLTQTVTRGPAEPPEICNTVVVTATIPDELCDLPNVIEKSATACCPVAGLEGCTPGFWKNHPACWCDAYSPDDLVGDVFIIPAELSELADDTLLEALAYNGGTGVIGKARNLLRHAVAGLLNACSENVDYPTSPEALIAAVNAALATLDQGEISGLQGTLAEWNELGCPINAHCEPNEEEDGEDTIFGTPKVRETPTALVVLQSTPNPFKHSVLIEYGLPEAGAVRVEVVDVGGRLVRSLQSSEQAAGFHQVTWDGRNSSGESMPAGVYFFTVRYQDQTVSKRMLMLE